MNFLPALCPVPFALGANWAVWIFGEMCPQVMLIELPLNMLVDSLPVGGARGRHRTFGTSSSSAPASPFSDPFSASGGGPSGSSPSVPAGPCCSRSPAAPGTPSASIEAPGQIKRDVVRRMAPHCEVASAKKRASPWVPHIGKTKVFNKQPQG